MFRCYDYDADVHFLLRLPSLQSTNIRGEATGLSRQNPIATLLVTALLVQPGAMSAQIAPEAVDLEIVGQIREEGFECSEIEALARHLTEVIGPRLTGSPGMMKANEWTVQMFEQFGLKNAVVEP